MFPWEEHPIALFHEEEGASGCSMGRKKRDGHERGKSLIHGKAKMVFNGKGISWEEYFMGGYFIGG